MKNLKLFLFRPNKELWFVLLSWVLIVITFYISFQVITIQRVAGQFITFGVVGIMLFGILTPVLWNVFIKNRKFSSSGIKTDKLLLSIGLSIVFSAVQYFLTLRTITLPKFENLLPLIVMALAVGFFENIFFRGWMQERFENSFGIIPAILLSAGFYSLYHVGYGMAWSEMFTLLIIGIVYSIIFRLTKNIFILFPLLTPMGAIFSQIKDGLSLPFESIYGFSLVIGFTTIALITIYRMSLKKQNRINQ